MKKAWKILVLLFFSGLLAFSHAVQGQSLSAEDRQKQEEYEQKISRYQQAGNQRNALEYINKLAFLYWNNKLYGQALSSFNKSLEINQALDNPNGVKKTHYYRGMIFSETQEYAKAVESFKNGLQISRQMNMKDSQLSGLLNLAQTYQLMEQYTTSNQFAQQALKLAKELNDLKRVRSCYGLLSENHKKLGHSEKSIQYFDLFASIDQHLKNQQITEIKKESENQVSRVRSEKQQTEKELAQEIDKRKMTEDSLQRVDSISRERQIQLTMEKLENKKIQAQLKLEKTIRNSFIIGFILIAGFSILLYHFYRQINHQNIQIQQQKNALQLQNTKLNDSLTYAENIQEAILPVRNQLRDIFDAFIIYQPKDIVSGDFYWFTQMEAQEHHPPITFLAVVDCTGHGVPGAFMSMIGNRLFNEIISEKRIFDPAEILDHLNHSIVKALKQERTDNTDGMDVCLISMEHTDVPKRKISFAGAKRPLFYYSQDQGTIKKIKGDRYSIGGINKNKKQKQFTTQQLTLAKGDILYLTTDGIFDQINDNGKRFTTHRFISSLQHSINQSMEEQGKRLEEEWKYFKGKSEQRDDLTVLGAKIL